MSGPIRVSTIWSSSCCKGSPFASRLKRGPLPVDEALARAIEIAGALARAHREGIIHRDLKPGNVMLTPSGAKVLDFGLARITRGDTDAPMSAAGLATAPLTDSGAVLGTIQYMAPEQLEGRVADARSDIYAFGATLYEMLTGKRAFEASSGPGVIGAILRGDTPSLLAVRPDLPPALNRILRTCLDKDPEARFASMHDVAMGLQWVRDEIKAGPPSGTDASGVPARRRFSITVAVVATMLVAIILGLSMVGWLLAGAPEDRLQLQNALQVTFAMGAETQPAWSPDGGRIAYTAGADIWIVQAAGGPAVNLTRDYPGAGSRPCLVTRGRSDRVRLATRRQWRLRDARDRRFANSHQRHRGAVVFLQPTVVGEWLGSRLSAAPERYELLACRGR